MYVWNNALLEEMRPLVSSCWILPVVHGSFEQVSSMQLLQRWSGMLHLCLCLLILSTLACV